MSPGRLPNQLKILGNKYSNIPADKANKPIKINNLDIPAILFLK